MGASAAYSIMTGRAQASVRWILEIDDRMVNVQGCFTNTKPHATGGKNGLEPRLRQLFG